MSMALRAAWMATVPVFTHCAYFAVWVSANFFAKEVAYFPGNGWPPQLGVARTLCSASASALEPLGHGVKGVVRVGVPPVMPNFPICRPFVESRCGSVWIARAYGKVKVAKKVRGTVTVPRSRVESFSARLF